jgi:hypothetical protein
VSIGPITRLRAKDSTARSRPGMPVPGAHRYRRYGAAAARTRTEIEHAAGLGRVREAIGQCTSRVALSSLAQKRTDSLLWKPLRLDGKLTELSDGRSLRRSERKRENAADQGIQCNIGPEQRL